jgi:hypothetical protein
MSSSIGIAYRHTENGHGWTAVAMKDAVGRLRVLVGHQGDPDVVDDERGQREGVEDLVEAEPAR